MIRAISRRQLTADIVLAVACLLLRFWIMWVQFRDVPWSIPTVIVIFGISISHILILIISGVVLLWKRIGCIHNK